MAPVTIKCPLCRATINDPEIVGESVRCAACEGWFTPTPSQLAELMQKLACIPPAGASQPLGHSDKVRATARYFVTAAVTSFIAAVFFFAITVLSAVGGKGGFSDSQSWFLLGAGLLSIGFWLYLVGQIVHIRANTEK